MHLDFIVTRVPTNGWTAAGKRLLRPPPLLFVFPPLPLLTHTLSPTLPGWQEVQARIPAGVSNSNQPTGTARGGRSHSSTAVFFFFLAASASCPRMFLHTCVKAHLDISPITKSPRRDPIWKRKSFWAARRKLFAVSPFPDTKGGAIWEEWARNLDW